MTRSLEKEPDNQNLADRIFNLISYTIPYGYIHKSNQTNDTLSQSFATNEKGKLFASVSFKGGSNMGVPFKN